MCMCNMHVKMITSKDGKSGKISKLLNILFLAGSFFFSPFFLATLSIIPLFFPLFVLHFEIKSKEEIVCI